MTDSPHRVTQREIAAKFGCTQATVSLALNGDPSIPAHVRAQIRELSEKIGYRPDPGLSMLARNRFVARTPKLRATIAYVVHATDPSYALQHFYFESARQRAAERGYNVFKFDLSAYPSGEAAGNVLYQRGVAGVIIPKQSSVMETYFRGASWERFSLVCCSAGGVRVPFHIVTTDVFEGTRLVWREVIRRGYQRIGAALFRHRPVAEDDHARYGASLVEQHASIPVRCRIPFLLSHPTDRKAFLQWVDRQRPNAIISFVNEPYDWLISAGYRVPEDMAFACCNVHAGEPHSGLLVQDDALGRTAVDFLIALLSGNQRGTPKIQQTVQLEPEWTEGQTLPWIEGSGSANPGSGPRRKGAAAKP